jgi:hypothetical protein
MLKRLCPRFQIKYLADLDPNFLLERGLKGLMLDLDNTLVAWGEYNVSSEMITWVHKMKKAGLKLCIISNALEQRVRIVGEILDIPWVSQAIKPRKSAFKRALEILDTKPSETATVGDQLFTDIWGGNRMALFTIWTTPLSARELLFTKFVRYFERKVVKIFRKKGIICE